MQTRGNSCNMENINFEYLSQERTECAMPHDVVTKPTYPDNLEGSFYGEQVPWQQTAYAFGATHILPVK